MKCERCGSDTQMQVQAVISAPSELIHQLSKQNLSRKDVCLMGVLWETADFICTNPHCGNVLNGYGNYVTNLKKEVERLKAQYEPETNANAVSRATQAQTYPGQVPEQNGSPGAA